MGLAIRILVSLTSMISLAATAFAATITGNVQGPDGKPFMGAFVVAENTQNKMTVSVLSNAQGRYHIGSLPAATYTVEIRAVGHKADPRADVRLGDGQKVSFDFALQKAMVRWSDVTSPSAILNTSDAVRVWMSSPRRNDSMIDCSPERCARILSSICE